MSRVRSGQRVWLIHCISPLPPYYSRDYRSTSHFMKINDILTKWILRTWSMWEKICTDVVQINKWFKNLPEVSPGHRFHGSDLDGISPLHPYYSRDYRSTSHIKLRSRRTGVFPEVQVCVFECFSGPRRVFQIHEKSWFFTTYGSNKKRPWAKPFGWTVLGSYFMKINDILTKWILKTYSM